MPTENIKKILLLLISALGFYLAVSLSISGTSLFLKTLGPTYLPYFLIGYALFFTLFGLLNAALSYRLTAARQFVLFVFVMVLLQLLAQVVGVTTIPGVLIIYFCGLFFFSLLNLQLFNLIFALFSPLQSKNFIPIVNVARNIGVIAGSFFYTFFKFSGEQLGLGYLGAFWMFILLILIAMVGKLSNTKKTIAIPDKKSNNIFSELKSTSQYIFKESALFKLFALTMFLTIGLMVLIEFKFSTVMAQSFSAEHLGQAIGVVYGLENLFLIFFNTFLLKRIIFKFGIINNLILYPLMLLISVIVLAILNFHYLAAISVYLVYYISMLSIVLVGQEQFLSILPKEKSHSGYLLIKGLLTGFAKLVFSIVLLIYTFHLDLEKYVNSFSIFLVAFALLIASIKLKKLYFEELKSSLFKEDTYLKFRAIDLLAEQIYRETGETYLRRLLTLKTSSFEVKSRVLYCLGIIGNYQTIVDIIYVLQNDEPKLKFASIQAINAIVKSRKQLNKYPVSKHILLNAYEQLLLKDTSNYIKLEIIHSLKYFELTEIIKFLEKNLKTNNFQLVFNTIEILATFKERAIIPIIRPYLEHVDLHVACRAMVALWQFQDLRIRLLAKYTSIASKKDSEAISVALYLIGEIGLIWEKSFAINQLSHNLLTIRHRAIIALIKLGETQRIKDFANALVSQIIEKNNEEVEFLLTSYRKMSVNIRHEIIKTIQQMPQIDADYIKQAMSNSRYVFSQELNELN